MRVKSWGLTRKQLAVCGRPGGKDMVTVDGWSACIGVLLLMLLEPHLFQGR